MTSAARSVEDVVALFERWGPHRYDEDVSQLDHALQTAAHAAHDGADETLVAAALLHDTGHLLDLQAGGALDRAPNDDLHHERTGARWLAGIFPPAVTGPIALHVAAKRYRCAVEPDYAATLSTGSTRSLQRQGGTMTPDEAARFERHPAHADAVRLRGWDDAGKVTDSVAVPTLGHHAELLRRIASTSHE